MKLGMIPPLRTAIISSGHASRRTLLSDLKTDPRFVVVGEFTSLTDGYKPIEAQSPDVTICNKGFSQLPEFPMFAAMLRMVGSALVTVHDDADVQTVARIIGLSTATRPSVPASAKQPRKAVAAGAPQRLVAIGASTGGIEALSQVLTDYPALCPPTVIVQHIKPDYLSSVVERFDRVCAAKVVAGSHRLRLRPGQVVFAPGLPQHLTINPRSMTCVMKDGPQISGHRPSVDELFDSAAPLKDKAVGVLLTGMGRDGARGLGAMRHAGAWTIAQDAETSTVYGMPRVAAAEGAVCHVLPLRKISKAILAAATVRERASQ